MFYIKPSTLAKRETFFSHSLPAIMIFVAFLGLSALSWVNARSNVNSEQIKILNQQTDVTANTISQRLAVYENILLGGAGLFSASENVSREEWRQYVSSMDLESRYPGFQGIGFTQMIKPEELEQHEQSIRNQGIQPYAVFPSGKRDIYTSIIYIEPLNDRNRKAIGFDMYSEAIRRNAMNEAMRSGKAVISDVVTLIQEEEETEKQPGFLMYVPVYKQSSPLNTEEQRIQNTLGFVYAPFRAYDLMNNTIPDTEDNYGFRMTDHNNEAILYTSENFNNLERKDSAKNYFKEITVPGNKWNLYATASPNIINKNIRERPNSVFWGGLIFSIVISGFIYLLLKNRSRTLAQKEEASIQEAKDELLALASHQLRTPATGVKQYIGMLREGFAGTLTKQQQDLIENAYSSNERQLSTINEILIIAKADAGQLKMTFRRVNISALLRDILDEQKNIIKSRRQKIHLHIPKKNLYVQADNHYLRMAIENLISNATKYTQNAGSIAVRLEGKNDSVRLLVSDSGVGVSKEDYPLLFKKFSRIPNELTSKVAGSGIGLYLTKKITEAHSGSVEFHSEEGVGSEVIMTLPK